MASASAHQSFRESGSFLSSAKSNVASGSGGELHPSHKRTYQACIPCRRRKVRCDLGPVDNPTEPPCARCRREGKECHFSATRRKRTVDEDDDFGNDDYTARNGRKRVMTGEDGEDTPSESFRRPDSFDDGSGMYAEVSPSVIAPSHLSSTADGRSQSSRTTASIPYTTVSQHQAVDNHNVRAIPRRTEDNIIYGADVQRQEAQHVTNQTAAEFLSKEINGPGDALHLLFEAAGRTGDLNRHSIGSQYKLKESSSPTTRPALFATATSKIKLGPGFIDPAITSQPVGGGNNGTEGGDDFPDAMQAWSRLRFVRAGWFTAQEAMTYIDYYYRYLAPLTPINPPDFSSPSTHTTLLSEEPVLAVTFLTVASRYVKLQGLGGTSRSFAVHEMLWSYMRGMIERLIWGQEQFGGGFCGAGADKPDITSGNAPGGAKNGGLRTLGTVESLLILTEWHPRALHFPPGNEDNELLISVDGAGNNSHIVDLTGSSGHSGASETRPALTDWLEPAWRSDRMCWMLLFNALALAFEVGIFDGMDRTSPYASDAIHDDINVTSHRLRSDRVRRLLFIYVTQTAGRLNWPSPLPRYITDSTIFKVPGYMDQARAKTSRHHSQGIGRSMDTNTAYRISDHDILMDQVHFFWMEITTLMKRANELLFPSRDQTRETIRSGRYLGLLETFQPLLRAWRLDFDKIDIPGHMRNILLIEYEYSRLYINSLALQAVVERWTSTAGSSAQRNRALSIKGGGTNGIVSMATLLELYRGNEEYIGEVIDASRNILRVVVDGLVPGDYLKHTPVRTYFRVLSGAMFLLKTFALGAKEDDVALSLSLMDRTIIALRTCVVDDVHLSNRIADLLETLTSSIRTKFVRLAANNNNGPSNYNGPISRSRSPMPATSGTHSPSTEQQSAYLHAMNNNSSATNNPYAYGHDALAGIATESIDPSDSTVIFMPPPGFSSSNAYGAYDLSTNTNPTTTNNINSSNNTNNSNNNNENTPFSTTGNDEPPGYISDWLALPLDPLLNNSAAGAGGVGQGALGGGFGPDVGNFDMLDLLLNERWEYEGRLGFR